MFRDDHGVWGTSYAFHWTQWLLLTAHWGQHCDPHIVLSTHARELWNPPNLQAAGSGSKPRLALQQDAEWQGEQLLLSWPLTVLGKPSMYYFNTMMLVGGFCQTSFFRLGNVFSLSSLSFSFYMKGCGILSNALCVLIKKTIFLIIYHTNQFNVY